MTRQHVSFGTHVHRAIVAAAVAVGPTHVTICAVQSASTAVAGSWPMPFVTGARRMRDPVPMRFRTDGWIMADDAAAFIRGDKLLFNHKPEELIGIEPAQPGDTWRSEWYASEQRDGEWVQIPGPLAGYAICCPKCLHVHSWNQATNCQFQAQPRQYTKDDGTVVHYSVCGHNGTGSCWNWTGSAEGGTLSATPSLHCAEALGGCGWHGHLTNGILKHC